MKTPSVLRRALRVAGAFGDVAGDARVRLAEGIAPLSDSVAVRATRANATTALAAASLLVLAGAGLATAASGNDSRTDITIHFSRAVGLYKGSSVKILGVSVGKIDKITPAGTSVTVKIHVDSGIKVPADATASVIPPALVSDRYIQLSVYQSGPVMPDNGDIPVDRTQVPVEKDDVEADLNKLDLALGPQGANKNGALSNLINVGAANLNGNGDQINQTLRDLTTLVGTLDDNKDDLVGTVNQLDNFTSFLLKNNSQIQTLYTDLANVSAQLSDDRGAIAAAFQNLSLATKELDTLATTSRSNLKGSVDQLVDITNVLVQDKSSLEELLDDVPLALADLSGSFDPNTQTLDVRTGTPNDDPDGLATLLCTALITTSGVNALPQSVRDTICNTAQGLIGSTPTPSAAAAATANADPLSLGGGK